MIEKWWKIKKSLIKCERMLAERKIYSLEAGSKTFFHHLLPKSFVFGVALEGVRLGI
jgi:hypothetical protein